MSRIYKILPRADWTQAAASGLYQGSGTDRCDGFIHFSTAAQVPETARRHFAQRGDLVVLEVEADELGEALRWEPARGGDLYPHLYGALDIDLVRAVIEAPLGPDGTPEIGPLE